MPFITASMCAESPMRGLVKNGTSSPVIKPIKNRRRPEKISRDDCWCGLVIDMCTRLMIGYAVKNNRRVVFLQERLTVYGLMFIVYGWACYELQAVGERQGRLWFFV